MKKRHLRVLENINKSIPASLVQGLLKTELIFPTLKQLAEAAVKSKKTPADEVEKYQAMLDSGYFDKTHQIVDTSVEKQIEDYIESQIKQAVADGLLPPKVNVPTLKSKSKRNVKRHVKEGSSL